MINVSTSCNIRNSSYAVSHPQNRSGCTKAYTRYPPSSKTIIPSTIILLNSCFSSFLRIDLPLAPMHQQPDKAKPREQDSCHKAIHHTWFSLRWCRKCHAACIICPPMIVGTNIPMAMPAITVRGSMYSVIKSFSFRNGHVRKAYGSCFACIAYRNPQ